MVLSTENKMCLSLRRQDRQVKVTLEFPEQSDLKAEQEFISRLKALYLEKIQYGYGLQDLLSPAAKDKEENGNE